MLHTSPSTAEKFAELYDCHGDSYTQDATVESLGEVFKSVEKQVRRRVLFSTAKEITPIAFWVFFHYVWASGFTTMRRSSLAVNALRACLYIYIRQLSSFRAPTLWLSIWLSLLGIFNTLFWVYANLFSWENGQNTRILEVRHFRTIQFIYLFILLFQNSAIFLNPKEIAEIEQRYFPGDCPLGLFRCCR